MQLLLETYMPELERLKMDQDLLKQQHAPVHHSSGTVQITTSNLPELSNWGTPTPAPRLPAQRPEDDLSRLSLVSSGDLLSDSFPAATSALPPVSLSPCARPSPSNRASFRGMHTARAAAKRGTGAVLPTCNLMSSSCSVLASLHCLWLSQ